MFIGEKLTDIRLLHGYSRSELARILGVTEQSIWQYENNYNGPKLEIVNRMKDLFHVKVKYFYEPRSVKKKIDSSRVAYRCKEISSPMKTKYEAAHLEHIEGLLDLFEQEVVYPTNRLADLRKYAIKFMTEHHESLSVTESIRHIAEYARTAIGIEERNDRLLFLLEKNGAFIFEKSLIESVDAYSVWSERDRPIIMLGRLKKSAVRRNFDLSHELGHLLLHSGIDMSELTKTEHQQLENEANEFAAYFLLPPIEFEADLESVHKISNPDSYVELKKKWQVSIQVMARQAYRLNKMTYEQHRYFYASMNRLKYMQSEPLDQEIKLIRPGKVRSSLKFLFENNLSSVEALMDLTLFDDVLLSRILGLDEDFLEAYKKEAESNLNVMPLERRKKVR
ncbi:XRE family transcriptional regulator [Saccharibacillus sp. CPCC 101409]|uniref:spr1629 family repressor/antitoxin n=1 Tax=Saccharibacillus sp. CPCC 101409 TaxID=3058041 RepID=UPI002672B4BA|nr:XRE family transcriptional regulator [Saccharibacillus sp. CPCC 101409]MDO3410312.1 XRE family transcriptional regulator [Saccharibacillus sp. CPCC 101409]